MSQPPTLAQAFWFWLKLGFISFGGPAGQIALMHSELVERRRWISEQRFLHALNYCMLLPGPEATQLAIYIGWLMHRTPGGIIAGLLFVLPALLILIALSWIYLAFGDLPLIAGALYGIKPAVVAIVLAAAWRIGRRTLQTPALVALAALAFIALAFIQLPFPAVVLGAGLIGMAGGHWWPHQLSLAASHANPHASFGPALIDDQTPTPAHARFSWRRLLLTCLAGAALGAIAWGALAWAYGPASTLPAMGWFFTKAALMSFGGAYAVLPYVVQGAVHQWQWLTAAQMIDGLALGETTPGPLIMIVAFVGFLGGWNEAGLGSALLGATVASLFTFLPSFIFILAGGPLVESTRGNLRLTAPLVAISAAVVGVIVSLALFFGQHVFLPQGAPDLKAILLGLFACYAVFMRQWGPVRLIGVCAGLGLMLSYWNA